MTLGVDGRPGLGRRTEPCTPPPTVDAPPPPPPPATATAPAAAPPPRATAATAATRHDHRHDDQQFTNCPFQLIATTTTRDRNPLHDFTSLVI